MTDLPYAEDIGHYWQTGQSSPEVWMGKTRKIIEGLGGAAIAEGFGAVEGKGVYMMAFKIGGNNFKVMWPVLPSRTGNTLAARKQAATLLHHDIKAKAMAASVLGTKTAFFAYLMLPDGRTASEVATPELAQIFPILLGNNA